MNDAKVVGGRRLGYKWFWPGLGGTSVVRSRLHPRHEHGKVSERESVSLCGLGDGRERGGGGRLELCGWEEDGV